MPRIAACYLPFALLLTACSTLQTTSALSITNPGFEDAPASVEIPGWEMSEHTGQWNGHAYEFSVETVPPGGQNHALRVTQAHPEVYGMARQDISIPEGLTGQNLKFSARTRTEGVGAMGWFLVATFKQSGAILKQHRSKPLIGSNEWQRVFLSLTIPPRANTVEISFLLLDAGTAWVDDVALDLR